MTNQTSKDFADFEKETLKETSLDAFKATLLTSFKKLHRDQLEIIEEKISAIEEKCHIEIREGLEKHIKKQLEENFQVVVQSCQHNLLQLVSPLSKRMEEDISRLNREIIKTNRLCQDIQSKYAFRWDKPFLLLITATALTGSFVGLGLFLMQTSPLAIFLMDPKAREAYKYGVDYMKGKEMYEASQAEEKAKETIKKRRRP